ncbi:LAMI_0A01310g1_1 [Lachancea mirantina]|uniref:LAMI_0A01310g1_1 n=1 Tax=Lachancea mirantina TaxID=1230905 RepID=A0A1G4IM89_9SACH|nr:LAMI_0A01310g1_1 [Lachancea mirantina]
MSLGTLYANSRIRCRVPKGLVQHLKLDVKIVAPEDDKVTFEKKFPLDRVPDFVGADGFKLTECIAIMYYLVESSGKGKVISKLLGETLQDRSQILRWLSFSNSELLPQTVNVFRPLLGLSPYNKKSVDEAWQRVNVITNEYEKRLSEYTYLATEELSLADLFSAAAFSRGFEHIFTPEWRSQHSAIMRWFRTVIASPYLKSFYADFKYAEKALEPPQNKKKEAKREAKKESKKEPVAASKKPAAEAPAAPKHPLQLLSKPTFVLDEWKRKYSNEDTRPVALPWFWEHYNPEEYSLWKVCYKYNDELTLTFMSNNLVGGFFNRLSASTKYMFGCLVVYGENNDNGIAGAIMVRGQDHVAAFDVAPDWESYEYSKLDPSNEKDKEFVNDMWAWDKPVEIDGKPREIADGKVLK